MTIEEVLQHDLKFRYMLLGRLQADCEYYLGFGNKSCLLYTSPSPRDRG